MILSLSLLCAALAAASAAALIYRKTTSTRGHGPGPSDNGWSLLLIFDAILLFTTAVMLPVFGAG